MSHMSSVQVDFKQSQESCLIAALEDMYGAGNVEFNENGLDLFGYEGDNRCKLPKSNPNYSPQCQIVVRRRFVGSASNDVGFVRTEDGGYKAIISEYDSGSNFNQNKQKLLKQNYTVQVSKKQLKAKGYQVQIKKNQDGTIKLTASKYK